MNTSNKNDEWQLDQLTPIELLHNIAELIDQASDNCSSTKAQQALDLCDALQDRLSPQQLVELYYYRANAWSVIREAKHANSSSFWEWDQPEVLREIFYLRSAVRASEFQSLEPFRQCQILVNTGNIFSHIGRPIEAIEYWNRALGVMPNFAMARGNLGMGLESYAIYLYDHGHQIVILKEACRLLRSVTLQGVVWDSNVFQKIAEKMVSKADSIETRVDFSVTRNISFSDHSLGRSKAERNYRKWALEKGLFLSPLNDLGPHPIAAHDVLHLPNMVVSTYEPPHLIGFFNQLKQEYVSARFLCWQGIMESEAYRKHYSDKKLLLLDTLDYTTYSIFVEQIKLAFRMAYSLFDKIALFVNEYWELGLQARKIDFQSIWFEDGNRKTSKVLRSCFQSRENLPLRGLYWLSKDFVENDEESEISLSKTMEPDAYKLRSLRNLLEHRYLKVHYDFWRQEDYVNNELFSDQLAFHISTQDLTEKTVRILKMARAALTYLSLAVHQEERNRQSDDDHLIVPMFLPQWN